MTKISFSRLRVILIDRDGVINHEPGPILNPDQFVMIPGSADAVAKINAKGWKCFVITNQAAIARGELSEDVFEQITNKMHLELNKSGAQIDGQYFCPHHPDWKNGRMRKNPVSCLCRKPGTRMLEQASSEHDFVPEEAVFIGDTTTDFAAASDWGTFSIGVRTGWAGEDGKMSVFPDYWSDDLKSAVDFLIHNTA